MDLSIPKVWLDELDRTDNNEPSMKQIDLLSRTIGAEGAAFVASQVHLRIKASSKFSNSSTMLFEKEALEQASHEDIARYHASLFPAKARIADLTCGIGGDLIAISEVGSAIGFDIDPTRLKLAYWNLRANHQQAELRLQNSMIAKWDFDFVFLDPSRRAGGRRLISLKDLIPNPLECRAKLESLHFAAIKLSPMAEDSELRKLATDIRFISLGRECREALAIIGKGSVRGFKAVRIETGSMLSEAEDPDVTSDPDQWIYEADPAAIRSHSLGNFHLPQLGDIPGYLTSNHKVENEWLIAYRRLSETTGQIKKVLKSWINELEKKGYERAHRFEAIKVRAHRIRTENVEAETKGFGLKSVVIFVYEYKSKVRYFLAERVG